MSTAAGTNVVCAVSHQTKSDNDQNGMVQYNTVVRFRLGRTRQFGQLAVTEDVLFPKYFNASNQPEHLTE